MHTHLVRSKLILIIANPHQFRLENEHAVGRDRTHAPRPVTPRGLNRQLPLVADAHVEEALVLQDHTQVSPMCMQEKVVVELFAKEDEPIL